jgi:hypothetical protein
MALANRQTAASGDAASTTINVATGSGNNRVAVAIAMQENGTLNLTSITLNGVAGTQLFTADDTGGFSHRILGVYWLDSDLPSSAGDYTLSCNATGTQRNVSGITYSSGAQSAPDYVVSNTGSVNTVTLSTGDENFVGFTMDTAVSSLLNTHTVVQAVLDLGGSCRVCSGYDTLLTLGNDGTGVPEVIGAIGVSAYVGGTSTPYVTVQPQRLIRRSAR